MSDSIITFCICFIVIEVYDLWRGDEGKKSLAQSIGHSDKLSSRFLLSWLFVYSVDNPPLFAINAHIYHCELKSPERAVPVVYCRIIGYNDNLANKGNWWKVLGLHASIGGSPFFSVTRRTRAGVIQRTSHLLSHTKTNVDANSKWSCIIASAPSSARAICHCQWYAEKNSLLQLFIASNLWIAYNSLHTHHLINIFHK